MIAPPGPYRAPTDQYQALFLRLLDQLTTPGYANKKIRVRRPGPTDWDTEYVSDDSDRPPDRVRKTAPLVPHR
jgi:hypothetical protein